MSPRPHLFEMCLTCGAVRFHGHGILWPPGSIREFDESMKGERWNHELTAVELKP